MFKVAVAIAIASFAVAYQEKAPRTEARGAGVVSSQATDLTQAVQLVGHVGPVIAVGSSDQERWIVSAGADATLRVWNAGSGALVRTLELDEGAVTALAVDERRALVGHRGGVIVLWDLERAEKVATFQQGSAPVTSLAFTNGSNTFAAAAQDGSVALFDISTPSTPTVLLDGREGSGQLVAAARLRGLIVSGGADRTIRLWQTEMQSLARTYRTQVGEVTALDITADGRYLAGAGADGSVRVWSNSSSRAVRTVKAHDGRITAAAFGPDRMLATAGEDGKVKLWNLRAGRVMRTFGGNTGPVRALSFSTEGRRLVSAGQDGVIRMWSLTPAPTVSGI